MNRPSAVRASGELGRITTELPPYDVMAMGFGRRALDRGPVQGPAAITRLSHDSVNVCTSAQTTSIPVTRLFAVHRTEGLPRTNFTPLDCAFSKRNKVNK